MRLELLVEMRQGDLQNQEYDPLGYALTFPSFWPSQFYKAEQPLSQGSFLNYTKFTLWLGIEYNYLSLCRDIGEHHVASYHIRRSLVNQ